MEKRDVEKMRGKIYKKSCVEIEQSEDDKIILGRGVGEKIEQKSIIN